MKNILLIVIVAMVACISIVVCLNRYNNTTKQGMQAINQTTQACTIDMQYDSDIICD